MTQVTPNSFLFAPTCALCGAQDCSAEILAPGCMPERLAEWPDFERNLFLERTDPAAWRLIYRGLTGGNGGNGGNGDPIPGGEAEARKLIEMLDPFDPVAARTRWYDSLGHCDVCARFYCFGHWGFGARTTGGAPRVMAGLRPALAPLTVTVHRPCSVADHEEPCPVSSKLRSHYP